MFSCAHWHIEVAGFTSTKSGIYKAKRKSRELTTVVFPGAMSRARLPSSLHLVESSDICFMLCPGH